MNYLNPKIAIIILNYNNYEDTLECLSSVKKITYTNFSIIVIDNGSNNDSARQIKQHHPEITLIENEKNLGFAGGNNVGIRFALENDVDAILLLNNDTIVDKHVLDGFVKLFNKSKDAILGGKLYQYYFPNKLDHLGGIWNKRIGNFDMLGLNAIDKSLDTPFQMDYGCGAALFIPRKVFETIGLLDEKFFLIWEEADFCFRAKQKGFKMLYCPYAKIWHKGSQSFTGGKAHIHYFWWRNRLLWIQKNIRGLEKYKLWIKALLPEMIKECKMFFLKSMQVFLHKHFRRSSQELRIKKLHYYKAGSLGILHFLTRYFGNAPKGVFEKK